MADSSNAFDRLPLEINQHIASCIEYDKDLCNFRLICRNTLNAIDADKCSFWRRKFLSSFEMPTWASSNNVKFKEAYQQRKSILKNGAEFAREHSSSVNACLSVLQQLIVDSFSCKTDENSLTYESFNMVHLDRFLKANNLLQIVFKSSRFPIRYGSRGSAVLHANPLLQTIQVLCTPMLLSLEPNLYECHYGFPDSQRVVYGTPTQHPLFHGCHGLNVNVESILHNVNFWKYHMIREHEWTLHQTFKELDKDEKPRWWSTQPKQGQQKLGKHWKGSYSFIERDDIDALRSGRAGEDQILDIFAGENNGMSSFQDLRLELVSEDEEFPWPDVFENHLHSLTLPASRAKTRAQKRSAAPEDIVNFKPVSFHFEGEGQDVDEEFFASGWLNPLPPQHGVPGWQRMTMMKYYQNFDGTIDMNALWAYEGVVLPGGQIILGRWWSPSYYDDEIYSGPFILWCVDGPKYEETKTSDTEVDFDQSKCRYGAAFETA